MTTVSSSQMETLKDKTHPQNHRWTSSSKGLKQSMHEKQPKEWKEDNDGLAQILPAEVDIVAVYATVPGYVSWRNSAFGSWFIKAFVDVMFEHAAKSSLTDILTMVNNRVAVKFQSRDGNKQIPSATLQLRKLLFFNPSNPRRIDF